MEPENGKPQENEQDQFSTQGLSGDATLPAGSRYDYSHLRESKDKAHWYATPAGGDNPPLPPDASIAPTRESNIPIPPPELPPVYAAPPPYAAVQSPMQNRNVRQRIEQRRQKRHTQQDNWAWVVIAASLLGVTIIGSVLLIFVVRSVVRGDEPERLIQAPLIEPTSVIYQEEGGAMEGNSLEILQKKWDGQERFTVLLMGLDKRPDESDERGSYFRTDSMMLISLDPATNSIGILSIPRDLYVEVPYAGLQRVNSAYVIGELDQPGGGPTLAKQTVQYNLGIRVNEYVTLDFQAVIAIINAIGGIEIDVPRAITDYAYPTMDYGTEIFHVDAGLQVMDGETALKYARTRHASDDIDRANRQQQVLFAARNKVLKVDMLDDLIIQAPLIYAQLRSGLKTGLGLDQIIELALWAREVPSENIHSGVVGWEYVTGYQTDGGANVIVPNRARLGQLMVEVFGETYDQ